jgi:hypothetical protein
MYVAWFSFPGTSAVLLVVTWNTLQQKIGIPHLLLLRYLPLHNWNRCSNWMLLKCTRCQTSTALHTLKGRLLKAYWVCYIYKRHVAGWLSSHLEELNAHKDSVIFLWFCRVIILFQLAWTSALVGIFICMLHQILSNCFFTRFQVYRSEIVDHSLNSQSCTKNPYLLLFDLVGKVRGHNKSQCNPAAMFSLASPLRPPFALDDIR